MSKVKGFAAMNFFTVLICGMLVSDLSFAQQVSSSDERGDESAAAREMLSDETQAAVETGGYVTGIVTSVGGRSIAVQDVDEDGATYRMIVKGDTTYTGIDGLSDINAGDSVSIDYYGLDDNLMAETIVMEKRAEEEEGLPKLEKVLSD
ncbi:MAG: hypothetical protein NTY34_01260 [Candidatus Omnitrophica bacterium]|nr:hypothetical protein [Candidatus Omnitrophota bacterium]